MDGSIPISHRRIWMLASRSACHRSLLVEIEGGEIGRRWWNEVGGLAGTV